MTMKQLTIKRAKALKNAGLSYRAIEARLAKSLGLRAAGNGTVAFRLLKA